jgi:hypothetical protein
LLLLLRVSSWNHHFYLPRETCILLIKKEVSSRLNDYTEVHVCHRETRNLLIGEVMHLTSVLTSLLRSSS